ncbi:hypothetical protein BEL04_21465 [Mucilaginibacter sp. PPCGB 2223]|uniref:ExbD/TolR family protein n=1 Tax=Mucilaginibacter sp. PPCGB 2223 TaxID=1886027 RepID=UPI000824E541|nr:biopolymer transporter ExbD [Mucilaginibacter sp. PPCGB 2223]OCX50359.1 hypothetical protein BEL04_21465 [Mucilaginibacter sp. PPCGB 2223]
MAELNSSPAKPAGKTPRKKLNARVDLTAMVDLAFLLITFFMLTTTLQKPKMFKAVMPDDGPIEGEFPASRTLTIELGKNNQVLSFIGLPDKPITNPVITSDGNKGIGHAIVDAEKYIETSTHKSMLVVIKASDHSVYDNLVNVLDELNIAGNPTYAITDIQPKDIAMLKQHNAY